MFNPVSPVSCRYGAPMGRPGSSNDFDFTKPLHLRRVYLDRGGYDRGGAYWGHGDKLYCAWQGDGDFVRYFRARSRDAAECLLREDFPLVRFPGERNPLQIYDAGPDQFDRYTAVYMHCPERGDTFAARSMSANPTHSQGFGQMTSAAPGRHLGKRITFDDLPPECQSLVLFDLVENEL